ncbi:MAG: FHA domain-containing protein [Paludisphaera borealis]|uniref:FHA domain-containing protein n=1 Tax=Paludisphaera borealis TaxID=1387353 RepID=UPI00284072DB|nr:FHA domain-containing protein [Paludisphaera borealis]MDR3618322.1 FHA domain-containing protein [Paludisphaera borealis]
MVETQIPMVNPGGESTMMGQWRIVLRQAEEAARGGRFEEAYALASRPEVADHHQAVQLRSRLGLELIARAARRGAADDTTGAIDDLHTAERLGAPPDSLAAARLGLADRAVDEIRASLDAGEPSQALERVEELARHKISGPALRRCREIAEAWQAATAEARRGEFGQAHEHLDRAERLAAGAGVSAAQTAIAAARPDLETRQKTAAPKVEALYTALAGGEWPRILAAAEAVVAVIPEHPAAKQARARAWQQIAAIGPSSGSKWVNRSPRADRPVQPAREPDRTPGAGDQRDEPPPIAPYADRRQPRIFPAFRSVPPAPLHPAAERPVARADAGGPKGRFLLWADAVGGFLVCLDDRIILGRAGPDSPADVPLMGDLSRNHAALVRSNESYLIEPHHPSFVNGKVVTEPTVLRDGDVIRLGSTVELEFRQPSPVSATARLAIVSRHRLPIAVDGVLLMAETCIVGAESQAHIAAPAMKDSVVLYRQGPSLWCRARGSFEVDGRTCASRAPLTLNSSVLGDGFSFSLEPLAATSV